MMKKIFTFILFLLISLNMSAFDFTYNGVEFKCKTEGQSVCIIGFSVKARRVVIPAIVSYKGREYRVKSVSTFMNGVNYLAEELVLEEGIEDIDKFCFNEFRKLVSVSLPGSIRHIGRNAFRDNKGLVFAMSSNIDENAVRRGTEINSIPNASYHQDAKPLVAQTRKPSTPVSTVSPSVSQPTRSSTQSNPQPVKNIVKDTPVDVDVNIPIGSLSSSDTYCVIIANEKYEDVPEVEYATRDGEVFREYCIKTLGVPEKQINSFINASYTEIKRAMNWMETIASVTDGQAKMIVYYAGHGLPSDKDKSAYLIPVDGFPKDITTCYKLSDMYNRLGKLKAQNVTVFMDACFSGVKRGSDQMLVAARGVAIRPKEEALAGNLVVFTAASDDETALSYQEKRHGMFTYFLLDKLKQTKGKVTFGDLFTAISSQVKKNSILENDKLQTPSVNVSASMKEKWQNLHF